MLSRLSGKTHEVITGVCFLHKGKLHHFRESTHVTFKTLSPADILHYVNTCKPFDKAGAYGIQEWIGMIGIERISGDYYNVVGLPCARLRTELEKYLNLFD